MFALPMQAQTDDAPVSAGTDFYFTVFDHGMQQQQTVFLQIVATNLTRMTVQIGDRVQHFNDEFGTMLGQSIQPQPLEAVHITTTEPCYVSAFVKGTTAGAETAILPTHLLGTHYMLQGESGSLIELNGTPTQTYSQFSVVGTANSTTLTIQSPVDLICVTNNRTIAAGTKMQFALSAEQVLLFQPVNYQENISGVQVKANHPVAVFQGNNLTRIPSDTDQADYTWEQARPTSTWGTDFIIPKSMALRYNNVKITALEDNTDISRFVNGNEVIVQTLDAGETFKTQISSGSGNELMAEHIRTSKPACCYLYFTGCTRNNDVGDPAMVEIAPMDKPSTDTRWVLTHPADNAPYQMRLLVTMRSDNTENILLNNFPLAAYSQSRVITDEYTTYEMSYSAAQSMRLQATQGGFSAYTMHVGKTAEASAFNLALPEEPYRPELCMDGKLLFREDFGGDNPSDPVFYSGSVSGMSSNYRNSGGTGMGSGKYVVTKKGYQNGIQWHRQDDHTYPNDFSRGYFLEVDGMGGTDAFFSTTIDDLCPGMPLTFSAYVVNVTYAGQIPYLISNFGYAYPRLKFVISDPESGEVLASQSTGNIKADERYSTSEMWKYARDNELSAEWQPVGINFTVPSGVSSAVISIYNDVNNGGAGNDFAIDDIEVWLCTPPVTILAPDTVCVDTKNTLVAEFENNGSLVEPVEYQWYFSTDSLNWTPLSDGRSSELKLKAKPRHTGWYKVAIAGAGTIGYTNCPAMSDTHKLYVIENCPPILCPEGLLLMHCDYNATVALCDTVIEQVCSGLDLSLIVNLPSGHADTRLLFRIMDASTGDELAAYDTGDVPSDSLQVGTTFWIPNGVNSLRWVISNNRVGSVGQPFAIDNTEIRLCLEPISIQPEDSACRKKPFTMQALYDNYDILQQPEYQWYFSTDSAGMYNEIDTAMTRTFTIPELHKSHEGWYRVAVSEQGRMAYGNCRSISEPYHLLTDYCNTAVEQYIDTVTCDTLLEYNLLWRGHTWLSVGTVTDTIRDFENDDSVHVHLTLGTKICCPDIQSVRVDSAVCDTLLPFLWLFGDTMLLFEKPEAQDVPRQHARWENCIGTIYTLALDTFHCERLYPIIVNKYNWQLLLDNVALRRFFPDRRYLAFQWYRNGETIPGATDDDYSEQNELNGLYQLRIQLDQAVDNDDEYIWSNVLQIGEPQAPQPVTRRIYNSSGILVGEDRMTRGVYFILYRQGDRFWTEKRLVP